LLGWPASFLVRYTFADALGRGRPKILGLSFESHFHNEGCRRWNS